nr:hypothetical protein [Tanacetum cinerariifolium]
MLDNSFGDETLKELTAVVIMMARIQPADDNRVQNPNYDGKDVNKVNASHKMISKWVFEHKKHGKRKTIINISDDDQIDSNIIFDDHYVENGGSNKHDSTAYDQYHDVKILAYNALREGLGYKNLERLKKAIASQPRMYHGEKPNSIKLKIDSPVSMETLEDTEES